MKTKCAAVFVLLCILLTLAVSASGGKLSADPVSGKAGETVTVAVKLQNPGIIATRIFVRYDPAVLQLTGAANGDVFDQSVAVFGRDYSADPYTLLWDDSLKTSNNTNSGTLCTLTFKILKGNADGKSSVRIAVDEASTFDYNLVDVPLEGCSFTVGVPKIGADTTAAATKTTTAKETTTASPSAKETTTRGAAAASSGSPASTASTTRQSAAATTSTTAARSSTTAAAKPKISVPQSPTAAASSAAAAGMVGGKATTSVDAKSTGAAFTQNDSVAADVTTAAASAAQGEVPTVEETVSSASSDAAQSEAIMSVFNETIGETVSATDETLNTAQQQEANTHTLLWLLLLIPVAGVIIFFVMRKKKA